MEQELPSHNNLYTRQSEEMTAAERHQLLVEWNDTRRGYPKDQCLPQLIEAQVQRTPDHVAVTFQGEALTYRELNRRANQLAHYLRGRGVGPEVLVGVLMERSVEMVVGLLGVLKAGGAYMPLDPTYPRERLGFMVEDASAPVLLTQHRLAASLQIHAAQIICLDSEWGQISKESEANPPGTVKQENLAYVIYTSGSTGQPKGAMNTHGGICNRLLWMQDAYHLTAVDRVLQKTPFSFDVSVWEFFWPLMTGARLVVARPDGHRDGGYLVKLIAEQKITTLHFVPSMLRVFLEESGLESCGSVRRVMCSGEALSFELQERFFARMDAELHNLYGPTEAAVDVTFWACERESKRRVVPIGRPIANTQIYILDDDLEPVPIGTSGELHIGGAGLARGYLNRPALTAERFITDPFGGEPGARLYKTGDKARYLPDGQIEFLGRLDQQVKIRGFRVELGEIEAELCRHPAVKANVVVVREDAPDDRRLVAYILCHTRREPTSSELRDFLGTTLPEYMLPSAFVVLDDFPLTANGKLNREALPKPEQSRPELDGAYVAPRTELERFLAKLWCEVLKLDRVGVHDKFFELGGDSLRGAVLINRLQRELGEFIYVVPLFEAPSVAEFSAFLQANYGEAVRRKFGPASHHSIETWEAAVGASSARRVDASMIARMRQSIPTLPPRDASFKIRESKNRPAVFILAPPRSGTTLLRVMLAGHPRLFSAAELQLLGFNTLEERRVAFSGKFSLWSEGTIRAIMEIRGCDAGEAKRIMEHYENERFTTKQFYQVLQEWIKGKTLVDKSPSYVLDLETLKRAESDFDNALYIHLARHPYAMVRSFESYHMNQVLFVHEHPFSARELGELVWTISHQNALEFLKCVPPNRQYRIRFEELVSRPQEVMRRMCETLGLDFHPDLVQPYKDKDKKMTDGIHAASTPMGDTKFHDHRDINPVVAESWRDVATDNFLGDVTWDVAALLGYEAPTSSRIEVEGVSRSLPGRVISHARRGFMQRQKELRKEHRGIKADKEEK